LGVGEVTTATNPVPGARAQPDHRVTTTATRIVLGYFAARRAHAKATFRVLPRAILADGQLERLGQLRTWQTVGVFHIGGGKIAECRLVPFDQYLFEELWS